MQFGIFQSAQWPQGTAQQVRLRDAIEQSVLADALGFDSVFITEHHFSRHGIISDNLAMLSYIAAQTKNIRLGTAVSVLPLHDPVRLAESVALVDLLSNGRLEFGIGRGYQWGEFNGFGLTLNDRAARFDEAIAVILRSWAATKPFNHDGHYWQYRDVQPQPLPLQKPHPPIWMATTSDDGFDLCVRHGWGVMLPQAMTLDVIENWVAAYRATFDRYDKPFDASKLILARGLYLGVDDASAWAEGSGPYLEFLRLAQNVAQAPGGNTSPLSFDIESVSESTLIGGPQRCREQLEAIRTIGIDYIIFFCNMGGLDHALVMASMQRFATEVLPHLRAS